ncbi:MAG TPA: hypothetical protein VFF84_10605 [Sphingobium sp.]|nr:hypothetical protein [Sphingobium sp.]
MMKLNKSLWAAVLAAGMLITVAPAAQAQTSVTIGYRDYDNRGDWRRDYRDDRGYRDYRNDRRYRHDRRYRYDHRRYGWNGWNDGYRYRKGRRCHTEWRWDRWQDRRVRVRVCR